VPSVEASDREGLRQPVVVVSQPMYFPWTGMLAQIRFADVFVFYDDVQFSKGGFLNRVQIKTPFGMKWLTVPRSGQHLGDRIDQFKLDASDWPHKHREMARAAYKGAPYERDALGLLEEVLGGGHTNLAQLARASMLALVRYFEIGEGTRFEDSSQLAVGSRSTERVVELCKHFGAATYLTGHGAKKYLDHELFERSGIGVKYIGYDLSPYPQSHGEFTPYVTALDLVANCGKAGRERIRGTAIDWRAFVEAPGAS
jgi:hypothetical protein